MLLFTQYQIIRGLPLSAVSLSRCSTCQDVCVQLTHAGRPFSDFKLNPDCTPKNPHLYNKNPESLRYEQIHMSVLLCIETIIEY